MHALVKRGEQEYCTANMESAVINGLGRVEYYTEHLKRWTQNMGYT